MEWKSDIATALCVAHCGWRTEEEHEVYLAAEAFVRKVRDHAMKRMVPHCPACGQRVDSQ